MDSTKTEEKTETIIIERLFKASPERLFQAWGSAEALKQWFSPEEGVTVSDVQLDFSMGGTFRITFEMPDASVVVHSGKYLEITPHNRLIFSWILDGQLCGGSEGLYADTKVSVDFEARGEETLLRLKHEGLPTEIAREAHTFGWKGCFETLVGFIA